MQESRIIDLVPNVQYEISAARLFDLLAKRFPEMDSQLRLDLINDLVPFEKNLFYNPKKQKSYVEHPTTTPRKFLGLFRKGKKYFYAKLEIKKSGIPGAGMGVYALEDIPSGSRVPYIGKPVYGSNYNGSYSFDVIDWGENGIPYRDYESDSGYVDETDSEAGSSDSAAVDESSSSSENSIDAESSLFVIDSSDETTSNWTRTINCQIEESDNNMCAFQRFDQVLLKTIRKIEKDEELFLWYGDDYIREYLKN